MEKCFVMFSGGIESVALLHWLTESDHEIVAAVHSVFEHPACASREVNANIPQITDHYKVPLLIHKQSTYDQNFGEREDGFHSSKHWVLAACQLATRYPDVKNFFWGVNSGDHEYGVGGDYHYHPRAWEFFLVFEHYCAMMNERPHGQKLYPPLSGMTKRQQWDLIPDVVKPWAQSCGHPLAFDGKSPCGVCYKCGEYKKMRGGLKPT